MLNLKNACLTTLLILTLISFTGCTTVPVTQGTDHSWRFIVTGDSRSNGEYNGVNVPILTEIANEIVKSNVDFALFTGDLVVGYSDQEKIQSQLKTWRDVMQPVYNAGIGVYPIRGNHDTGSVHPTMAG